MAAFDLTSWERAQLAQHASAQALAYLGHYHDAGLFRDEIATLNNWRALADKLAGREPQEPLLYRGLRRNGFNPNAD